MFGQVSRGEQGTEKGGNAAGSGVVLAAVSVDGGGHGGEQGAVWVAQEGGEQGAPFLRAESDPAEAVTLDEGQVGLLLAGDISRGDKGLAQRDGLEEHVGTGLTHDDVGGGHEGRNFWREGQGREARRIFVASQQGAVGACRQDNLRAVRAASSCASRQNGLYGAAETGRAFAAALQEDGKTVGVEAEPGQRFYAGLAGEEVGMGEPGAHGPASEVQPFGGETCLQRLFIGLAGGGEGRRRLPLAEPGRVDASGIGKEHDQGKARGALLQHAHDLIGEKRVGRDDQIGSQFIQQTVKLAAHQAREDTVRQQGAAGRVEELKFRRPQPERVTTYQPVMPVKEARLRVKQGQIFRRTERFCVLSRRRFVLNQEIAQGLGKADVAATGSRSQNQYLFLIKHSCLFYTIFIAFVLQIWYTMAKHSRYEAVPVIVGAYDRTEDGERAMLPCRLEGDGPPLLLIHGWGVTYRVWRNLIPLLRPHFRLILVELPGVGAAGQQVPHESYYPACAGALEELRAALGIEQWSILAYSTGTRVGEAYVQQFPQHVLRAVFLCPIFLRESWKLALELEQWINARRTGLADWMLSDWRLYVLLLAFGFNLRHNECASEWMNEIELQPRANLKRMLLELPGKGRAPFSLPTTPAVPTLFVWGKQDALTARPRHPRPNDVFISANHSAPMLAARQVAEVVLPFLTEGKLVAHPRTRRLQITRL